MGVLLQNQAARLVHDDKQKSCMWYPSALNLKGAGVFVGQIKVRCRSLGVLATTAWLEQDGRSSSVLLSKLCQCARRNSVWAALPVLTPAHHTFPGAGSPLISKTTTDLHAFLQSLVCINRLQGCPEAWPKSTCPQKCVQSASGLSRGGRSGRSAGTSFKRAAIAARARGSG
jgi:hypothetical protein